MGNSDKKLRTMSIDRFVAQYLNIVHHDCLRIEKVLYNNNLMASFQRLRPQKKYETFFKNTLDKQIEIMRTSLATPDDMKEYRYSHDVSHFSQKKFPYLIFSAYWEMV